MGRTNDVTSVKNVHTCISHECVEMVGAAECGMWNCVEMLSAECGMCGDGWG